MGHGYTVEVYGRQYGLQRLHAFPIQITAVGLQQNASLFDSFSEKLHKGLAFSIGYADHPRYDETRYAKMVAEHFKTDHHVFQLTFKDVLDTVEPMLNHLGEPFADSSLLPTSLVSRYTREHVTVALSGDGGDELFGGYWRYFGHAYLDRYRRIPTGLRKMAIEPLLKLLPAGKSNRLLDRLRQVRKLLLPEYYGKR